MERMAQRLGSAGACLLVGVLALEGTVRLDDWAQYGVPFTASARSLSDLVVRDSLGLHARPGGVFKQFQINAAGFRGPEIDIGDVRGKAIVTAGASETFGLYETRGKEWPRQLEDSLYARCGLRVPVLNAAFAGMALPTVKQDYERRLSKLSPKVVIYYPTPMQYLESVELPKAAEPSATSSGVPRWGFRFVTRLRDAIKRAVPAPLLDIVRQVDTRRTRAAVGASVSTAAEPGRLQAFDADLRGLVGRYHQGGSTPVLVLHRHRFRDTVSVEARRLLRAWERFYPLYSAGALIAFDDSAAMRTRRIAADSGAIVVDPLPSLRAVGDSAFADFSHFTDQGSAAMAGAVSHALMPVICGDPGRERR